MCTATAQGVETSKPSKQSNSKYVATAHLGLTPQPVGSPAAATAARSRNTRSTVEKTVAPAGPS
ncbi:Immunoglobulin lambda constant 7 [Plecturocebus cupreus]